MLKKCEICEKEFVSLDSHHIQSTSKEGLDKKWNITDICQNCHRMVHLGLIIIEGRFNTTNGIKVVWRKFDEESITGMEDPEVYLLPNSQKLKDEYLKRKENEI